MEKQNRPLYGIQYQRGDDWISYFIDNTRVLFLSDQSARTHIYSLVYDRPGLLWRTVARTDYSANYEPTGWTYDCRVEA